MDPFRRKLKEFVWIALLAFVGLAVAPTISRAIHLGAEEAAAGRPSHQQMAATAAGQAQHHHAHHHQAPRERSDGPAHRQHTLDHCGLCIVAACFFALSSAPSGACVSQIDSEPAIASIAVAPRLREDWSPATSRGPPLRG